jgi:hypothetical protein
LNEGSKNQKYLPFPFLKVLLSHFKGSYFWAIDKKIYDETKPPPSTKRECTYISCIVGAEMENKGSLTGRL